MCGDAPEMERYNAASHNAPHSTAQDEHEVPSQDSSTLLTYRQRSLSEPQVPPTVTRMNGRSATR